MFPASVESNVEQYLKKNRSIPANRNAASAPSDASTASAAGIDRDLRHDHHRIHIPRNFFYPAARHP